MPGLPGEGKMAISYGEQPVTLKDGTVVSLRKPAYSVTDLAHGPLGPATTLSARVTPQMIGLGLVEQIHPADILAHADPDDRDGDGISGKAAIVRDKKTGALALGRFGWKASAPSIRQQTADAFAGDIGISTPEVPHHWGDCTETEADCLAMPNGVQERLGSVEAPDPIMDLVTFYSQNLAVPARRDIDNPAVLKGKQLFYQSGCVSCHTPKFVTRRDAPNKAQSFQLIWPYSDFLLHDLGDGLADGQQVGDATGNEWRTAPLWGIGLTKTVNGHTFFLHDGRARNLTEAILWHGGEAEKSRDAFAALAGEDRDALDQIPGVALTMKRLGIVLAIPLCAGAASMRLANEKATEIIEGSVSGFVRPAYAALHERADALTDAVKTLCAEPSQANLQSARDSFRGRDRRLVLCGDHPLRADHRTEPAGAHAVLAGPQGHRPQAGAGDARRQGRDRRRSGAAAGQERRHARAWRTGVRAVRHRRRRACRGGRSLSLPLWRGGCRQCRDDCRRRRRRLGEG